MATPRPPPPEHIPSRLLLLRSRKVHGTCYVWADARANTSVAPGSARMSSSQLLVDATQGGIVPVALRGVRLSMQPEQRPPDIAVVKLHPFLLSPLIALRQAWSTQKTTQAPLPRT